jgi:hypothetical protein
MRLTYGHLSGFNGHFRLDRLVHEFALLREAAAG